MALAKNRGKFPLLRVLYFQENDQLSTSELGKIVNTSQHNIVKKMPLFPAYDETAIFFSMFDEDQAWCRTTVKPFSLDEMEWKTV